MEFSDLYTICKLPQTINANLKVQNKLLPLNGCKTYGSHTHILMKNIVNE